ncbi:flagellar biosynthesis anti-sigma factor FlgM [Glaciimonas sp. PAMC28666]|uniref:flagellar biosynthesis anti-sigma factor FlgM n=1 Tax=Glaciimonas sp. PAMC28666 TaxID=2807626 RepID=UPI001963B777|nr:flagellar biosynthesis anti-sigma factor FlgM [Glaciimonas sp. PAMC28666]QRX83137.1 flagellar biosynthesis anti-sigma factor FlgM [Glaciimonas sp. PAMC28666]
MKIQQPITALSSAISPPGGQARASTASDAAGVATSVTPQSPADLTSLGAQVRQLQTQLAQPGAGDFNAARVEQIRLAISSGQYQVNTGNIADGLIKSVRELFGQQTS